MIQDNIFRIIPRVQHYEWGGKTYIADLINNENASLRPFAELWIGTHALCPSWIIVNGKEQDLVKFIGENKQLLLGPEVLKHFQELPYLLKVLDVNNMLSIQVHPNREQAVRGYEAEERAGISLKDAKRNYKDRNHKPEVMVALSDFWLLHGFKTVERLVEVLESYEPFFELLSIFRQKGYLGLYTHVMLMKQQDVDEILKPVVEFEKQCKRNGLLTKTDAGWWVCRLFEDGRALENIDRGVFSIYFFNLLQLKPGDAIFQAAGIPHAYLEGQNVELMANSDNVIRGGLTNKHVDVEELLKLTKCEGVKPVVMQGSHINHGMETIFMCPVKDFSLSKIEIAAGEQFKAVTHSLEMIIVLEGNVDSGREIFKKGEVLALAANSSYSLVAKERSVLYKAFVPV